MVYLLGIIVGIFIGVISVFYISGRGYFELDEIEEDGAKYHNIRIRLFPDQKLFKKKLILLVKSDSLK